MIEQFPIECLINFFSTPFFIYNEKTIKERCKDFLSFPKNVKIYYAIKANPNEYICEIIKSFGFGFDIASDGELEICKSLGVEGDKIIFTGPGKTEEELKKAIEYDVYSINAESLNEISKINKIAEKENKKVKIGIRVNPSWEGKGSIKIAGSTQFGIPEENLNEEFFKKVNQFKNVKIEGIHVFYASQILDLNFFKYHLEKTFELVEKLEKFVEISFIDLGGGFGIPYKENERKFPIIEFSKFLKEKIREFGFNDKIIIFEPGRYIVGESGILVCKVVDVKSCRGENFIILDGGINILLRPVLTNSYHPIVNISKINEEKKIKYKVCGPLCTSLDVLGEEYLPKTDIGDYIAILKVGAYGYTESMPLFISRTIPAEYLFKEDGSIVKIRNEIKYNDMRRIYYDGTGQVVEKININ